MVGNYFAKLYQRTMAEAYSLAFSEINRGMARGGQCLDCGANAGNFFRQLNTEIGLSAEQYRGIEWNSRSVAEARRENINVIEGDLNTPLPFEDDRFEVVFALSVLEHLIMPCHFIKEARRVLAPGGMLVLLTPNISTLFTAALVLAGKMPSSGPHPDSDALLKGEEVIKVNTSEIHRDFEGDTPEHRHMIVFSYLVLQRYLTLAGFSKIRGRGFGLYPFPNFMQPLLEKIDPYHCHQMVWVAEK